MKKRYALMVVAAVLVLCAVIGGSLAALDTNTENPMVVTISEGQLALAAEGEEVTLKSGVTPGSVIKFEDMKPEHSFVKVDSSSTYDVYVMVTINHYFTDSNKDYIPFGSNNVTLNHSNNWIEVSKDNEETILFFKTKLSKDDETDMFFDSIEFNTLMDNSYTDSTYHLNYTITAVQAGAAVDAIAAETGLFVTIDDNGVITSVSETR